MSEMRNPTTSAECVAMLRAVLAYLDDEAQRDEEVTGRDVALAAIRVEEALEALADDAD